MIFYVRILLFIFFNMNKKTIIMQSNKKTFSSTTQTFICLYDYSISKYEKSIFKPIKKSKSYTQDLFVLANYIKQ